MTCAWWWILMVWVRSTAPRHFAGPTHIRHHSDFAVLMAFDSSNSLHSRLMLNDQDGQLEKSYGIHDISIHLPKSSIKTCQPNHCKMVTDGHPTPIKNIMGYMASVPLPSHRNWPVFQSKLVVQCLKLLWNQRNMCITVPRNSGVR